MSLIVIPSGNTPALTPQDDTEHKLKELGYAISDDTAKPSLLHRWSSPLPIMPGSEKAVHSMKEREAQEPYTERGRPTSSGEDESAGQPTSAAIGTNIYSIF